MAISPYAVSLGEGIECVADCGANRVDGSCGSFAKQVLELAKTCSIGFRSGEDFGRKNSLAPTDG